MDFNSVELDDLGPNELTPETPEDFIGIRIAAPSRVKSGVDHFAICGTLRFSAEYVYKFPTIQYAIVLVAVGARSHRAAACSLHPPGATLDIETPVPFKDPDWMTDHSVQLYFNVDLLDYMDRFPGDTDNYFVYALIENHVSNVVRVAFEK